MNTKKHSTTLRLVLKGIWFNLIKKGIKRVEYREITPYWIKRLTRQEILLFSQRNGYTKLPQLFDDVEFYLGYSKDRPKMRFKVSSIDIGEGDPELGAEKGKKYFRIHFTENKPIVR